MSESDNQMNVDKLSNRNKARAIFNELNIETTSKDIIHKQRTRKGS